MSRLWVFSDLHLLDQMQPLYKSFLEVLSEPTTGQDHVVLAGDIFDILVGDSQFFKERFPLFFAAIKQLLHRQVNVHYIEGNHDFAIKKLFPAQVQFHEESVVIDQIYIAHGDLVDQEDRGYLKLRQFLRSSPFQKFIKIVPGQWVQAIGQFASRPLTVKSIKLPESWPLEKREHLRNVFRVFAKARMKEGLQGVILGHCHDLDDVAPYYFNMGYPPVHGFFLFYDGAIRRRPFPAINS